MIRLRKDAFTVKLKLGGERLRAEIFPEQALAALAGCTEATPQAAVQLLTDLLGAENTQKICDFYGGSRVRAAEKLLPGLLNSVLKKSLRRVKKSHRRLAGKYL